MELQVPLAMHRNNPQDRLNIGLACSGSSLSASLVVSLRAPEGLKVETGGPEETTLMTAAELCLQKVRLSLPAWREVYCANVTKQFHHHISIRSRNALQPVMQRCLT